MEINYKKNLNPTLFNENNKNILDLTEIQNYLPLYNNFFNLTPQNYSNFILNYTLSLNSIISQDSYNKFSASLINSHQEIIQKDIFIKFSPLIDPIKYLSDKYDLSKNLMSLPILENNNQSLDKTYDLNNTAYIDGFFTFLTSKLLNDYNFIHGIDCYGNFLAVKSNFLANIDEDIDFLFNCDAFHNNNNKLFKLTNNSHIEKLNFDTRNNKKKLIIEEEINRIKETTLSNLNDIQKLNHAFTNSLQITDNEIDINKSLIFECNLDNNSKKTNDSSSNCSSRTSNTNDSNSQSDHEEDSESGSSCSTASEDEIMVTINNFPVNLIALECCTATLDSYISNNENIKDLEWDSIVIQILMMLITYQKVFKMTHNDLHTNNIMYIHTEKKYLNYKFNNKHYKVPTFGKIYKIIDFGRAIYSFKGKTMCSDSYHKDGDAATLYNFGTYKDPDKPTIEPNYSFDLARLGCSIFDFFIEDLDDLDKIKSTIKKIILNWCNDDKDKNILYKNNGQERYPDFKLYKMIARTVHKHTPQNVLNNKYFEKYTVPKKNINKKSSIFNIDELPCLA